MTIDFMPERQPENRPRITVFGVGGAGGNAVNNMIAGELEGVDFVVANTDAQSLFQSLCENRVRLGVNITQGLGAGARADIGKVAAEEALDDIQSYLEGNNMVFIAAGMGGGTGTGAAPVIARAAREHGILTVGVVTKPFHFEGSQRMRVAERGIQELHQYVDTLIVIPNQNLFRVASEDTTFADAFGMADDVLHAGVRGVTDLMVNPGLINLDFADIRTVMGTMGKAMMGTGEAEGESRATEAAEAAINNPLLDNASIEGARGVLINVTGGTDVTLHEVDTAASRICKQVDEEATIIFGTSLDQKMDGHMRVAVIATGIDSDEVRAPIPDSTDNIHVLGFSDRKGASGGGSTMSAGEPEKEAAEPAAVPSAAATGTDPSDLVIPVAGAVAESAAAVSGGAQPAPAVSTPPQPSASPSAQTPAPAEARARHEHRAVAASPAGGVAARATVAPAEARVERPAARFTPPEARTPEKKPSLPLDRPATDRQRTERPAIERPAPSARRAEGSDATMPGRPSLFERMTGTGRARRNGADGETPSTATAPRTPTSAEAKAKPGGPQKSAPEARQRSEPSPRSPTSPTLGGGTHKPAAPSPAPTLGGETRGAPIPAPSPTLGSNAPKAAAPTPEPLLDGFSPSSRAPGGTEDPLDIPAFLRRQAN
ncbi:MAG: cell division protein FtsZ [Rhodospirillales bacterium]|nr:cell division protein FtsZ [Rhodospirillales bacterium]